MGDKRLKEWRETEFRRKVREIGKRVERLPRARQLELFDEIESGELESDAAGHERREEKA